MKIRLVVILLALQTGALLAAEPDSRAAQIDAAVGDAVGRLRADIESQPLGMNLTVRDFLNRTGTYDQLVFTLKSADQIGGPRWIDGETCQIKLAIASSRVRDKLVRIATESGRNAPLPPDAMAAKLRVWEGMTFTATGTSISAERAQLLRPMDAPGPWRNVSDDSRKATIHSARENAIDRVLDSVGSIEISAGKTVSQMLTDKAIGEPVRQWIAARPVTRLEFKSDGSIEITLFVDGHGLFNVFCDVAATSDALPKESLKLAKIRHEFERTMAPAIGSSRVTGQGPRMTMAMTRLPRQAPAWIEQPLATEATAKFKGTRLKTARDAEDAARDLLRAKVDTLEVSNTTIADVAKRDPAVEKAVQAAMDRAKAYKIDYLADGSTTVKVSLDPRDLWDQLRELP